mmetsp:Transcript_16361/g.27668  ORF Transcript_16361/g.27668 Transcript_16361/m.27668 type:complete len:82 (-) Transcript_16361:1435-1680(-)
MMMGGFGRVQKISYVMNTIAQGGAAFIVYCFVFLEKYPVFECWSEKTGSYEKCEKEQFCELPDDKKSIDWDHKESLHNMIE